ncbi:MAG: acetylornithine transaminase [Planctomycetes bacterium]|nr:acetylornithine transaminase [Planctomycetota bacterium]
MTVTEPAAKPSALFQNYGRSDVCFVRGEGVYLSDSQGRSYLDAFAGVAVSTLGHGHPRLTQAISTQAAALLHCSNYYTVSQQEDLGRAIVDAAFPGRVLFCNSGTEANEAAYKLLRLWGNLQHGGKKTRIIAFQNGFHGRTMGSLSVTANPKYREPFAPLAACEFLPYGDVAALDAAFANASDIAGVFVEPIQGEGGVIVPPAGFFARLRDLCSKHQALLVVDEIQTGFARTGRLFCHQHEGITPDIMTMAKGLGGGVPIGAVLATEAVASLMKPGMHGTTFGGNPLACAAGLAVIGEITKPGFVASVAARGEQLRSGLIALTGAGKVRGRGLLIGVQLAEEPATLVKAARDEGLIVGPSGNNTLRIAPPLIISAAQIDELLEKLGRALKRV